MKKLRNWIAAMAFVATAGGATLVIATPQTTFAACNDRLLTFPAWFKGLTDAECNIKQPGGSKEGLSKFVWTIVLNIVEFMLQLVGYVSVGFIIAGGYRFMISAGSPDGQVKSRKTIVNAVIGLVISIFSVGIINAVSGAIR